MSWLKFKAPRSDESQVHLIRNKNVNVFPSPYDIPEALRTFFDTRSKHFVIEFRYIDEEPRVQSKPANSLFVSLGRNSHRLYRIEIDEHLIRQDSSEARTSAFSEIEKALNKLQQHPSTSGASANYQILKNGILNQKTAILEGLSEANQASSERLARDIRS